MKKNTNKNIYLAIFAGIFVSLFFISQTYLIVNGNEFFSPEVIGKAKFTRVFNIPTNQEATPQISQATNLLFVGDMMLGRDVESYMNKFGDNYPLQKMEQFFYGFDAVVANLEGTIPERYARTPSNSLKFSFKPSTPVIIKNGGIDFVSLANNHSLDNGSLGYEQTLLALAEENISSFGHASTIDERSILKTQINDRSINLIGFNTTWPTFDEAEALELIRNNSDSFTVIYIHWGEEYKSHSNVFQQKLAHSMIDSGADLIIGHHPHVVQEVEVYNNKAIFYSLGNFIFDQYFSSATQESIAVGVKLENDKITYYIFPLDGRHSQAQLMSDEDRDELLEKIASESQETLREDILTGRIILSNSQQ